MRNACASATLASCPNGRFPHMALGMLVSLPAVA